MSRTMPLMLAAALVLAGCGGTSGTGGDTATLPDTEDTARDTAVDEQDDPDAAPDAVEDPVEEDAAEEEPAPAPVVTCSDDPPTGADLPDPVPVYAGTCPTLAAGRNTITSGGSAREFLLAVPADMDPAERLPVAFLWHWLGGDAAEFFEKGEVQPAVDEIRFIAVAPEAKGDLLMKWPFLLLDSEARMEEEARFFDDMLACVAEQLNVNASCVSSVGVSSGALWTSQLAQLRSTRLASFLSLSGGTGVPGDYFNPVHAWTGATHKLPAMVLWGGPTDFCGLSFSVTSGNLEAALVSDGHFFVECIHNCAHAQPPMTPPPGESAYVSLWTFILDHPYWLDDGESPYQTTGLPGAYPEWCGIGPGSATIREGECSSGPLGDCF